MWKIHNTEPPEKVGLYAFHDKPEIEDEPLAVFLIKERKDGVEMQCLHNRFSYGGDTPARKKSEVGKKRATSRLLPIPWGSKSKLKTFETAAAAMDALQAEFIVDAFFFVQDH